MCVCLSRCQNQSRCVSLSLSLCVFQVCVCVRLCVYDVTCTLRTQIGMFRPIRMDHTNCLQVAIKSIQFNSIMFSCNGPFLSLSLSPTHKHTHAQTHTEEPGKKDGSQITDRGFLRVSEQAFKMRPIPRHTCVCDHKLLEG